MAHNSFVKIELHLGVKEPDGIVTYKEKLLLAYPRVNELNKAKLK